MTEPVSGEFVLGAEREEMYVGEHVAVLGQDFASGAWTAECSCGWEHREECADEAEAIDAWDNHCDVVFMEATGG